MDPPLDLFQCSKALISPINLFQYRIQGRKKKTHRSCKFQRERTERTHNRKRKIQSIILSTALCFFLNHHAIFLNPPPTATPVTFYHHHQTNPSKQRNRIQEKTRKQRANRS